VLAAALIGTGLAGAVAIPALIRGGHPQPASTVADAALNQRAAQATRADRADRPSTSASASPSAVASSASPSPASPTPAATKAAPTQAKVAPTTAAATPEWVAPMAQYTITSCYGYRTVPYTQFHQGIDFANAEGTPERAAAAGTVIMAGDDGDGYGNKVVIQHGPSSYTLYGHAEQVLVTVGQHVTAGQTISLEGATGDATGPHLHFEVWTALWTRIDPAPFLRSKGIPIDGC
jgi:murein DD-endopeptidase MepM/ murein hydrolase activator NlpD